LNKVKRNIDGNKARLGDLERVLLEGIILPEIGSFEIKADLLTKEGALSRSSTFKGLPENQKSKTQLISLFREF
jgi:hypothetical protein